MGTSLEMKYIQKGSYNTNFNRLLSKHVVQKGLNHSSIKGKFPYDTGNKTVKNNEDTNSTYACLNRKGLDNLDSYRKRYKDRYSKKKGLAKLDCYFEKKAFDKFNYIDNLAQKLQYDKKTIIKKIFIKYFIRFILLALLPFLGLIFPHILHGDKAEDRIFKWCGYDDAGHNIATLPCDKGGYYHFSVDIINAIHCLNFIISYILLILVISVIIYTFVKAIKYEKIKSGKGKMNAKEYYHFCKDIF
ncbi:Plasmodium exported protein, unknown function [Plasmodium vivax]|uniref:Variable surface protein Vir35 n=1 Tax=Plasmodium vivax TaxID=5855 RepID=A0A1G4ECB9_PLAVI|nr:Plasmodium exported protein, unknown function [Plasmodium vivax]